MLVLALQNKMSCFLSPCVRTFVEIQEEHRVSFSLLQCTDSMESHLASIHLSRETITEGQLAYLGKGWPLWFRRVDCHANVHMRASTGTHMRGSGVPEQPVNIQHFMDVLVGARNGQRADTLMQACLSVNQSMRTILVYFVNCFVLSCAVSYCILLYRWECFTGN